jgi:hypothetical protein
MSHKSLDRPLCAWIGSERLARLGMLAGTRIRKDGEKGMSVRRLLAACCMSLLAACGGGDAEEEIPTSEFVSIALVSAPAYVGNLDGVRIQLAVTNSSQQDLYNVAVQLQIGSGLLLQGVNCRTVVCAWSGEVIRIAWIGPGATVPVTVVAGTGIGFRGHIDNKVSVSVPGDAPANNEVRFGLELYQADVRVTGTPVAAEFASGGMATYSMVLSNAGPDAVPDAVVQNWLSSSQTLLGINCVASAGAICPAIPGAVMAIPLLPSGSSLAFTINAAIAAGYTGPLDNTMSVNLAGDSAQANNVKTASALTVLPVAPSAQSFIVLRSDSGDSVGQGRPYWYDRSNAILALTANGSNVQMSINGDEKWSASFSLPGAGTLQPGVYASLPRSPQAGPGYFTLSNSARSCNTSLSTVTLDAATYVAGVLSTIDLHFEQHCEGGAPALRGLVHWAANDSTWPPGPVSPVPAGLWAPDPAALPATGNYIYLQSDPRDAVLRGSTFTYTQANAALTVLISDSKLYAGVDGNEEWGGQFAPMNSIATLQPGYYANLHAYPSDYNPARGGLAWTGQGRGCSQLGGWFVIDAISYVGTAIASVDLRFEQRCAGSAGAMHGKVHWVSGDTTQPSGPVQPPPSGLWAPTPGVTPASGNYIYLQGDAHELLGPAFAETYTQFSHTVFARTFPGRFSLSVAGSRNWTGNFQAMGTLAKLQTGYYGNLQRYPFHNAAMGGLDWSGEGRGCGVLSGWFVVDAVAYQGDMLSLIDLRFEQYCDGIIPALRGRIHWTW